MGTLQKRLPPLLRQEGVGADVEAANRWLASVYMAQHNARFAVEAAEDGSAFVPFAGPLADILCVQEERVVGHDNTVRYGKRVLQIPQARHRHHFVKAKVKVHDYADGSLALFHGPRRIADYDAAGTLLLRGATCGQAGRRGRALRPRPLRPPCPTGTTETEADI